MYYIYIAASHFWLTLAFLLIGIIVRVRTGSYSSRTGWESNGTSYIAIQGITVSTDSDFRLVRYTKRASINKALALNKLTLRDVFFFK